MWQAPAGHVATGRRWAEVATNTLTNTPTGYDTERNAIRAMVKITAAATGDKTMPWALGPKRGTAELVRDLSFCQGADEWVERAVQDVVVRSAPGSLASAKSALQGWAAFADQVLGANGKHLPPTPRGLAAWSACFLTSFSYKGSYSVSKGGGL